MTTTTTANPVRRLPVRDRLRIERYLLSFSWPMQDYPRTEYKQIKAELRASLAAAAADVGVERAVADLGSPFALADSYIAGLGRKLPRWSTGMIVAALAVSALIYLATAYTLGVINTLEATGNAEVELWIFGATTTIHQSAQGIWVQSTLTWAGAAIYGGVALVAFVLGSRLWRAFSR